MALIVAKGADISTPLAGFSAMVLISCRPSPMDARRPQRLSPPAQDATRPVET
ncbi:MAG: hypothetical protein ABI131_01090 [Nostocoides sp.]